MGYEEHAPMPRRGSMTHAEEKERRASIKAIMADPGLSPMARRRSIQHLMDGRRNSLTGGMDGRRNSLTGCGGMEGRRGSLTGASSVHSGHGSSCAGSSCGEYTPETLDSESATPYGYGDASPYGYGDQGGGNYMNGAAVYGYGEETAVNHTTYSNNQFAFSNEQTRRTELNRPHCTHYDRKCTIIAPCCGAAFGCRICHDDCPALPPKINNGGRRYHRSASLPSSFTNMGSQQQQDDMDTHHNIDRFAIREVICRECFTRQSSKT